jgi:hypothetical protein
MGEGEKLPIAKGSGMGKGFNAKAQRCKGAKAFTEANKRSPKVS